MPVRRIIRMGHPTLREPSRSLSQDEIRSDATQRLVVDMIDTLHDYGGVGLAAPQVNEPVRLAIIELNGGTSRYGELPTIPLTVFVNPRIEVLDPATAGYWEGCLSVPGLRGFVERPQHIRVSAKDLEGNAMEYELRGFAATVFQHEFDHLDGTLYVDRLKHPRLLMFEEEFVRHHAGAPALD